MLNLSLHQLLKKTLKIRWLFLKSLRYYSQMKHEGKTIEPRDIVKANAEIYRNSELIRMEKEEYNRWLAVNVDDITKKNHPDNNNFFNYEH